MLSMASQCSSELSAHADEHLDTSMSSNGEENRVELDLNPIDDLIDRLVVEATQLYAVDSTCKTITAEDKQIIFKPERREISVAVKRLRVQILKEEDAGKSYYELRILADVPLSGAAGWGYNREDISSVLIGYASLDGMDNGCEIRRYSFLDSQHLFKFTEVLGQTGRFEDAAF